MLKLASLIVSMLLVPSLAMADLPPHKNAAAGVTVTVAPKNVAPDAKVWEFQITLDTHSQELTDDLLRTAALGGEAPLEWSGAAPGGPHRAGGLRFRAIEPYPRAIELRIVRPGEPAPRSFRWQLE